MTQNDGITHTYENKLEALNLVSSWFAQEKGFEVMAACEETAVVGGLVAVAEETGEWRLYRDQLGQFFRLDLATMAFTANEVCDG